MFALNLPVFAVKIKKTEAGREIFDSLRRKYVALTPEEWVRQHFVNYLQSEKHYPISLMANEVAIKLNSLSRRCDTVIYNNRLDPLVIVEYKQPDVAITQQVFDQIARYNSVLRVKYLIVSNGLSHYCGMMDYEKGSFHYLSEIPDYNEIAIEN
ncbi:MAG: type I restriction enzyme HsdR N-terminal domain-containing protein [Dysgonamonadaceae bacterium]|nr:type I restriction enzyme HsdR N-terminal domain-containing protein [Dysgonamonadaceae bacterium]